MMASDAYQLATSGVLRVHAMKSSSNCSRVAWAGRQMVVGELDLLAVTLA